MLPQIINDKKTEQVVFDDGLANSDCDMSYVQELIISVSSDVPAPCFSIFGLAHPNQLIEMCTVGGRPSGDKIECDYRLQIIDNIEELLDHRVAMTPLYRAVGKSTWRFVSTIVVAVRAHRKHAVRSADVCCNTRRLRRSARYTHVV